jgi:hypothetical protein
VLAEVDEVLARDPLDEVDALRDTLLRGRGCEGRGAERQGRDRREGGGRDETAGYEMGAHGDPSFHAAARRRTMTATA